MLRCVTITGADDGVDPAELIALSRAFPFVEWGILRSMTLEGQPRYPSFEWRRRFRRAITDTVWREMRVAVHLCGQLSRDAMSGEYETWREAAMFLAKTRVQLNGFSSYVLPGLRLAMLFTDVDFICQVTGVTALGHAAHLAAQHPNVTALWDVSGGRGISPKSWFGLGMPAGLRVGYAGGIGPHNVVETLDVLCPRAGEFWVDMESGVRTDDRFDLDKVRRVLELAAPYVKPTKGIRECLS